MMENNYDYLVLVVRNNKVIDSWYFENFCDADEFIDQYTHLNDTYNRDPGLKYELIYVQKNVQIKKII